MCNDALTLTAVRQLNVNIDLVRDFDHYLQSMLNRRFDNNTVIKHSKYSGIQLTFIGYQYYSFY
jgi:hypothetical protein